MRLRNRLAALGVAMVVTATMGACGSGGDDSSGGSSKTGSQFEGRGPISFVSGKDTSGVYAQQLAKWNADHPNEQVKLIELPESADAQRQQFIQNAQTKSDAYDVVFLDVVWTAEFAANGWVEALPEDQFPLDQMLQPAVETNKYFKKLYGVPYASDGGMLYYRTDLLKAAGIAEAPKTWDEMKQACQKIQATPQGKGLGCYGGQYEKYEGLTVNFSEAVNSAGGEVVKEDGKANVNTPEAKKGLDFLVDGFKSGVMPREAITWKEEEGRRAFQDGKLIFHRQWPYQYALASKNDGSSKVVGKFAVAPLPGLTGPGKSTLGGHNLSISKFSKNKATALDFVKWFTNQENAKTNLTVASLAPVYTNLYDDPALQKQFPYLPTLKQSIMNAEPRPAIVRYGDATAAIQESAYAALTGKQTSEQALSDLQSKLDQLIAQK
ncbi:carbohydrate ABC transporter substrate-binding protein, CUT1 family [Micromonospora rhizosphaerae]|uniref:Carbohydrate ABC transporter substrate-binding protein, CUT1 family n=1 Tax=Micromonospora rhizosphaerae TaxID=568872 RepID=A0A1C6TCH4_9ACTN|nr:ABC transporter substrate-binding protein [Micromonospora rhizosphaerae]SCL39175.1 carbohydrate ABC transporter substrate-binding protein, CUT1 family [Micromonospora rhizosphaerae]